MSGPTPIPPPAALARPVSVPDAIAGVEPVKSVRTPVRLSYDYIPGSSAVVYLEAFADKTAARVRPD